MEISKKSEKRILVGNISIMLTLFVLTTGFWHFYSWYSLLAPYGTLIGAVGLSVTLFCYVDIREMLKDKWFILMAVTDIIALINLIVIKSGLGAFLTVFNFLLAIYLADKIRFSKKQRIVCACYLGFFFFYWTFDVKGYFKGYNTNYGGLVLISGFVFALYAIICFKNYLVNVKKYDKAKYIILFEIFMFAWGENIIAWYRSRNALLGLIVFAVLMLIPEKVFYNKVIYRIFVYGTTLGAVVFSLLYVWLGFMKNKLSIQIFYKDIVSGREEIWSELWSAYIKAPITGIGSSYEMKLDWLGGLFEVHNGMLDLLIVHGLFVFIISCIFVIKRMLAVGAKSENKYRNDLDITNSSLRKCALSGMFALMIPAFFENFIIVEPFTIMLMLLMGVMEDTCECGEDN